MILAAVAVGLAAATFAVMNYAIPYRRHQEIQRRLEAFRLEPNPEHAEALARVAAKGPLYPEEVQEISRTILALRADTQKSYPAGRPIEIDVVPGHQEALRDFVFVNWKVSLRLDGGPSIVGENTEDTGIYDAAIISYVVFFSRPAKMRFPLNMTEPGTHAATVLFEAEMDTALSIPDAVRADAKPGFLDRVLVFLGLNSDSDAGPCKYHCTVEVPVEILIEDAPAPAPAVQ